MAWGEITTEQVDANSPINVNLTNSGIKNNDDDHETRINNLEIAITTKSADYTITSTDGVNRLLVTTGSSANVVITLPDASLNSNRTISVIKADTGTKYVEIAKAGSDTIRGSATSIYSTDQYDEIKLISDGSDWVLLGGHLRTVTFTLAISSLGSGTATAIGDVALTDSYSSTGFSSVALGTGCFSSTPNGTAVSADSSAASTAETILLSVLSATTLNVFCFSGDGSTRTDGAARITIVGRK